MDTAVNVLVAGGDMAGALKAAKVHMDIPNGSRQTVSRRYKAYQKSVSNANNRTATDAPSTASSNNSTATTNAPSTSSVINNMAIIASSTASAGNNNNGTATTNAPSTSSVNNNTANIDDLNNNKATDVLTTSTATSPPLNNEWKHTLLAGNESDGFLEDKEKGTKLVYYRRHNYEQSVTSKIPVGCAKSCYKFVANGGGLEEKGNMIRLMDLRTYTFRDLRMKYNEVNKFDDYFFVLGDEMRLSRNDEDEWEVHDEDLALEGEGTLGKPYIMNITIVNSSK